MGLIGRVTPGREETKDVQKLFSTRGAFSYTPDVFLEDCDMLDVSIQARAFKVYSEEARRVVVVSFLRYENRALAPFGVPKSKKYFVLYS